MTNPTDTNQASEKLDDILQNLSWAQHKLGTKGLIPLSKHEYEAKAKIETIIRTEKLKLLAEVRERVIGEDVELNSFEIPMFEADFVITSVSNQNYLRADQRISLNKLEAEL